MSRYVMLPVDCKHATPVRGTFFDLLQQPWDEKT